MKLKTDLLAKTASVSDEQAAALYFNLSRTFRKVPHRYSIPDAGVRSQLRKIWGAMIQEITRCTLRMMLIISFKNPCPSPQDRRRCDGPKVNESNDGNDALCFGLVSAEIQRLGLVKIATLVKRWRTRSRLEKLKKG